MLLQPFFFSGIFVCMSIEEYPKREEGEMDYVNRIGSIMQQAALMGANDYEIPALRDLQQSVESGVMSGEVALERAEEILAGKQDYH